MAEQKQRSPLQGMTSNTRCTISTASPCWRWNSFRRPAITRPSPTHRSCRLGSRACSSGVRRMPLFSPVQPLRARQATAQHTTAQQR